jgi:hypothetical protein
VKRLPMQILGNQGYTVMLSTFAMLSVNSAKHRDAPTSEILRFAQGDKKRTIPFNDRTTPGDHKVRPYYGWS